MAETVMILPGTYDTHKVGARSSSMPNKGWTDRIEYRLLTGLGPHTATKR